MEISYWVIAVCPPISKIPLVTRHPHVASEVTFGFHSKALMLGRREARDPRKARVVLGFFGNHELKENGGG